MIELAVTTISVDGENTNPSDQDPDVGVVRSVYGNSPDITARILAHMKAVFSVQVLAYPRGTGLTLHLA